MKVITRGVIDWATLEVLEEDSYEYEGPVALAKDSGSPPQPVDPYAQAAAQYGLSTGTAEFNAALNRPNVVNPLGSTTWSTGGDTYPVGSSGTPMPPSVHPNGGTYGLGGSGIPVAYSPSTGAATSAQNLSGGGSPQVSGYALGNRPAVFTGTGWGIGSVTPPKYTETTQLAPQFQSMLQQPIDTSQIPGMPGGPSLQQNVNSAENATFNQEMSLLQPQEQLQSEQLDSQLAAQGITPGSAAYTNAKNQLGRQQGFQNAQVANQAVTTGLGELPMFYGLGSTSLQNQIAARNAPINEFEAFNNGSQATTPAMTPDISGAFGQQYQGQLAGYNANVASNNSTTSTLGSLALLAAMYFSDKRLKEDVRQVGKTNEGLPVYTYRFKGDPRTQMGVMAQDVEKDKPEAVFSLGGRGGPKMVNYEAIR